MGRHSDTYFDDMQGLVDGSLGVEGEAGVDLGGDLAGDDLQDLLAEGDQKSVEGGIDLGVEVATLFLGVLDGVVNQFGILGLLGGGEDERRVGGGILGLVLSDGCVTISIITIALTWGPKGSKGSMDEGGDE